MRRLLTTSLLAFGMLSTGASAQLIGEEVRGTERICTYRGNATILSGPDRMIHHRTSLGQNCPVTPPVVAEGRQPPPAAPLVDSTVAGTNRVCTYEQFGSRWSYNVPTARACPAAAGMIEALLREDR